MSASLLDFFIQQINTNQYTTNWTNTKCNNKKPELSRNIGNIIVGIEVYKSKIKNKKEYVLAKS